MYAIDSITLNRIPIGIVDDSIDLICPQCQKKVHPANLSGVKRFRHNKGMDNCQFYNKNKCKEATLIPSRIRELAAVFDITNKKVVFAKVADDKHEFKCLSCLKPIVMISRDPAPVFVHRDSCSSCTYFTQPNAKDLRIMAINHLASRLRNKENICIYYFCNEGSWKIQHLPGDVVKTCFTGAEESADVTIVNNGITRYTFGIKSTHQTKIRSDPSFELKAIEVLSSDNHEFTSIHSNQLCQACTYKKKKWMFFFPSCKKVGPENYWYQEKKCSCCDRDRYDPFFYKGSRALCTLCLDSFRFEILRLSYQKRLLENNGFTQEEKIAFLCQSEIVNDEEKQFLSDVDSNKGKQNRMKSIFDKYGLND